MKARDEELAEAQEQAEIDRMLREMAEAEEQRKRENAEFLEELRQQRKE